MIGRRPTIRATGLALLAGLACATGLGAGAQGCSPSAKKTPTPASTPSTDAPPPGSPAKPTPAKPTPVPVATVVVPVGPETTEPVKADAGQAEATGSRLAGPRLSIRNHGRKPVQVATVAHAQPGNLRVPLTPRCPAPATAPCRTLAPGAEIVLPAARLRTGSDCQALPEGTRALRLMACGARASAPDALEGLRGSFVRR